MTDTKKVIGNLIPPAPVPSSVKLSMVPPPPEPVEKADKERVEEAEAVTQSSNEVSMSEVEDVDAHPKGTILIKVFENSPYEVEFEGMITGSEIDIAWKAMMKEYRVWKHTLLKRSESDGGV